MKNEMKRDSFVLYTAHYEAIGSMTIEEKGMLLDAVFNYHIDGRLPEAGNSAVKIAFGFLKSSFDVNNRKYREKSEKNRQNAEIRWKQNRDNKCDGITGDAKHADNDTDNGIDIGNDSDIGTDINNTIYSVDVYIDSFNKVRGSKFRTTDKVKRQFQKRIDDGFTIDDMMAALKNAMKSEHHIGSAFKYLTPEFITRSDKLDCYLQDQSQQSTQQVIGPGEWMQDGNRYYKYMEETFQIPESAPPRTNEKVVYSHENDKWIYPSNY